MVGPEVLEDVPLGLGEVGGSGVLVFPDLPFEEAEEEPDVAFCEGVGTRGLVVAGAPEGGHGLVKRWQVGVEAYLMGESFLCRFDPVVIWFFV